MEDKRDISRHKKRLNLRFGIEKPNRSAFTEDISKNGLFIKTTNVLPLGTRVKIELILPNNTLVLLEGVIRWSNSVQPNLIHVTKKAGMGVMIACFISGEENYHNALNEIHALEGQKPDKRDISRHKKRLNLRFGIEEPNRSAFTEDISNHGLFIKTTNVLPLGTRVKIELILPNNTLVLLEGVICWSKRVPPNLIYVAKKAGMGVMITSFISGEENYYHALNEIRH